VKVLSGEREVSCVSCVEKEGCNVGVEVLCEDEEGIAGVGDRSLRTVQRFDAAGQCSQS
jgi:hypothetical protein